MTQAHIPKQKFFVDAMLGKLARWLRILGYDSAYERNIADGAIVDRVFNEHRWLLTRDRYLVQRKAVRGRFTLIRSDFVPDQLQQIRTELGIRLAIDEETVCRCVACNHILENIPPAQAGPQVPLFVAKHQTHFTGCPHCGQLYWPGTHWGHLQQQLKLLNQAATNQVPDQ
ncbi:Mut7-C RNAse domain-containing protein [Nitrospira sp. T9]|uniref:Mut7-C RNAse domain-containing protein n=1 Tax=unclassified Nitrospira TaxID=2652172 RepID=UPI003F984296